MHRPKNGLALGIIVFGLVACDNPGGPGGATGGAGGTRSTGDTTSTGGTISQDSSSNAGGATSAGGAAAGAGGSSSASDGGASTASTTDTGVSTNTGGTTSATGGTTGTSSATGGAAGEITSASGGATSGSQTDAGADSGVGGTDGVPDLGRDASAAKDVLSDNSVRFDTAADSASDAIATNCACLGQPTPVCTPTGHLTYTLARAPSPTADQADAYNVITCAMDMAVAYYNCYANITGSVRVTYDTGVTTADGNINGSIRFGASRGYMQCATAMHEIAHTQGIGTAPQWAAHVSGDLFVGANAAAQLQAINSTLATPLYTAIHADSMHFWPYGLNYESEATGTDILIDHCKIVVAIRKDLGL
jgi:stress-induced morphogen